MLHRRLPVADRVQVEELDQQIMNQYRTFVSKNKIFQEFQKAYVEFVQVCDEYKKDGEISTFITLTSTLLIE